MKNLRFPFSAKQVIIAGLLVVFVFLMMDLNSRLADLSRQKKQLSTIQTEVHNIERTEFAVQTQIAYATSNLAIEEHKRVDEKKVRPGEVAIILVPDTKATPIPQIVATPAPTHMEKWQVWWTLFFGE